MQRSAPKSLLGTLIMEALSSMKSRKCLPDFRPIEGLTHRSAFATDFSHSLFSGVAECANVKPLSTGFVKPKANKACFFPDITADPSVISSKVGTFWRPDFLRLLYTLMYSVQ